MMINLVKYLGCFVGRCNSYFSGGINIKKALKNLNDIFKTFENYLENISQLNIQEIISGSVQQPIEEQIINEKELNKQM
ncbi:NIMA related kinase 4 [Plasmodium yoelii yoelii]|uniref:NIMA related kinase 4 n=1 Tax=Plasmodium yoelii yoelii TaxID=73239 RepID=A0AAE9WR96_PLAYO|nr:NIMA related kinase 4 [Plasmodium yoelii yoelii]